jgi:DNA-binding Lrp family transcriptional regulator
MDIPILTEKNIQILKALLDLGDVNQKRLAEKTGLTDAGVKLILKKMQDANIIEIYPDYDNGRLVKKIKLKLNPEHVKEIIRSTEETKSLTKKAIAALQRPKIKNE